MLPVHLVKVPLRGTRQHLAERRQRGDPRALLWPREPDALHRRHGLKRDWRYLIATFILYLLRRHTLRSTQTKWKISTGKKKKKKKICQKGQPESCLNLHTYEKKQCSHNMLLVIIVSQPQIKSDPITCLSTCWNIHIFSKPWSFSEQINR